MLDKSKVDPVTVAILDKRFLSLTEEMARALVRTSRSPIFAEARDFATGLFDKNLRLVAQNDYLPVLAGALPLAVENISETYEGDIWPGDIFIHNDCYGGNSHSPDLNVVKPVFYEGELLFWSAVKGHMVDMGGRGIAGYDPTSTSVLEDGLVIPACKLYQRGKINRSVWDLVLRNVNVPAIFEGDLRCEVGSITVGERGCLNLLDRYGPEVLYGAIDQLLTASENEAREKIRQVPDGEYFGEKSLDHDAIDRNKPVTVKVKVIKKDADIIIDLAGSDPQATGYVNSTWANTISGCRMAVFYSILGDVPRNSGSFAPIKIMAPEGTCVNPKFPASVTMATTGMLCTIAEAIWLALAPAIPSKIAAPHGKSASYNARGLNPSTGRIFSIIDFLASACGSGGTEGYDGWDMGGASHTLGQLRMPDPEIMEMATPVHILRHENVGGMEGAGKFRGGHGARYRVQYLVDCKATQAGPGMRDYSVASGVLGGKNAKKLEAYVHRVDGSTEKLDVYMFFDIKAGDIYEQKIMGGGGFGPPYERDPERVRQDVADEWLTVERARKDYGVVIDPMTKQIDHEETRKLRRK